MKVLLAMATLLVAGFVATGEEEPRVAPDAVNRDFVVTVDVRSGKGSGSFVVVGNLFEGAVRVPVLIGEEVAYVVEVTAPVFQRNSNTLLKPVVEVRVLNPEILVTKGEEGTEPLAVLSCQRSIDWNAPGELRILTSERLTISVTLKIADDDSEESSAEDVAEEVAE